MAKNEETIQQYLGRIRQVTALFLLGFDTDFIVKGGFDRDLVLAVRGFIETVKTNTGGKYPQLIIRYAEDET